MSSMTPETGFTGVLHRKVAGIPVLYILMAIVVVLIIVALRTKKATPAKTTTAGATQGDGTTEDQPAFYVPPSVTSTGTTNASTVAGASTTSVNGTGMAVPPTNDQWESEAIAWLMGQGYTLDVAMPAIQNFINGQPLTSTEQVNARDAAVQNFGLPPEPITYAPTDLGSASAGPTPPVDTSPPTDSQSTPSPAPPVAAPPPPPPPPAPALYYTVPRNGMTQAEVASRNGISVQHLENLNGGSGHPVQWPAHKGERVRVG